jgi:hypothetical protein
MIILMHDCCVKLYVVLNKDGIQFCTAEAVRAAGVALKSGG